MYHTFIFKELSLCCIYFSVAVYSFPSDVTLTIITYTDKDP